MGKEQRQAYFRQHSVAFRYWSEAQQSQGEIPQQQQPPPLSSGAPNRRPWPHRSRSHHHQGSSVQQNQNLVNVQSSNQSNDSLTSSQNANYSKEQSVSTSQSISCNMVAQNQSSDSNSDHTSFPQVLMPTKQNLDQTKFAQKSTLQSKTVELAPAKFNAITETELLELKTNFPQIRINFWTSCKPTELLMFKTMIEIKKQNLEMQNQIKALTKSNNILVNNANKLNSELQKQSNELSQLQQVNKEYSVTLQSQSSKINALETKLTLKKQQKKILRMEKRLERSNKK